MAMRALPLLGRPRGRSILSAAASPKSSGKTSRAGRARRNVSLLQAGLSRPVRSGLRLRLILLYLTSVGFTQADYMHQTCPWCEHQHVEPIVDVAERLVPRLAVLSAIVFNDQGGRPLKFARKLERDAAGGDVLLVLGWIEANAHLRIVYTYIHECKKRGAQLEIGDRRCPRSRSSESRGLAAPDPLHRIEPSRVKLVRFFFVPLRLEAPVAGPQRRDLAQRLVHAALQPGEVGGA